MQTLAREMFMSNKEPRISAQIIEDQSSVTVSFLPESGASGLFTLSVAQLTGMIAGLGNIHAQMVDGLPLPSIEGQAVNAIFNTRWFVQPEPLTEGSLLTFYHPAYGPVGFLVPRDQVLEMVRLLSTQTQLPATLGTIPN